MDAAGRAQTPEDPRSDKLCQAASDDAEIVMAVSCPMTVVRAAAHCFVREANASDDQLVRHKANDDASIYAELCFVEKCFVSIRPSTLVDLL